MIVYLVDTFTSAPFGGNPAAVCLLGEAPADGGCMQRVAAELNQPATAFLASGDGRLAEGTAPACRYLRWRRRARSRGRAAK
jgi:predicted PhzF superfamily epimerase YddE/YHI9